MRSTTVFDCFCGFGGLSLGAELAGLNVLGGVDANAAAVEVYAQCFPKAKALNRDLLVARPGKILRDAGISRGDVDILVGGPPCQPYSINNHQRGVHDSRCELVQRYLEFVSTLRPNWLLMENVPAFASIEGGKFLQDLLRSLRGRGYSTAFGVFDATCFGVPQKRRRLVVLAGRDRSRLAPAMNEIAARRDQTVNVGEALGDLPESISPVAHYSGVPSGTFQSLMRLNAFPSIQAHIAPKLGEKNLRRIRHVPAGGNWRNIPRALLPPGMQRAELNDHTTRYGRLLPTKPAFTLLTKCDPHWGCFVHPTQDRIITIREAARLQSIPDRVHFTGTMSASYKLIGNAVPPLLAKGILETIR